MKLKIVLRVVCLLITAFILFWMFVMSGQDADNSTDTSNWVGYIVASVIKPGFRQMTEQEQAEYVASIDHYVRKAAHFFIYFVYFFFFTFKHFFHNLVTNH